MQSEWRWFGESLRDSLLHPVRFAKTLRAEHYGLAGVLIVVVAGVALSIAVDAAVILSKGADPLDNVTRLVLDAVLLGVRLAIVVALVALVAVVVARIVRVGIGLDEAFTALSYAMAPLLFAPLLVIPLGVGGERADALRAPLLALSLVIAVVVLARSVLGIVVNLAGVVGGATVVVAAVALAAMAIVLQDQLARVFFTTLTYAPQVLAPPAASPIDGRDVRIEGASFRMPLAWRDAQRGVPGIAADYELPDARLVVRIATVSPLTTADSFAFGQAQTTLRDFSRVDRTERGVVRIDRAVALDDRWFGDVRGTRLLERQYAFVVGRRGYVFEFTFFTPADEGAALSDAARIAASITLTP